MVPHGRRITAPDGVRLLRWRPHAAPIGMRDGLPVSPAPWTALSLLATLRGTEALRLADRSLQRGWITRADIAERLRRYPNRHGNNQLRRLLDATADGAAAESERRLHRVLRQLGIAGWIPNFAIWSLGELVAVVDVALPERRVAIEVDGMAFHVDVDRFRHDRHRQNSLVALGWTVLRFTWHDLTERAPYVAATIRAMAA